MAKLIKYRILSANSSEPDKELGFAEKSIECKTQADFDANYPIAEREAIGEITVDGEFEAEQPTQLDRIEAQVTYTAMMTDTLLEV